MKIINILYTPLENYKVTPGVNPYRERVGERGLDLEGVFNYLKGQNLEKRVFQVRVNPEMPKEDRLVLETRLRHDYPKLFDIVELTREKPQNKP